MFKVQGLEFRASGLGFKERFRVRGLGFSKGPS